MNRRHFLACACVAGFTVYPLPGLKAYAHREKLTTTNLFWNQSTKKLEISHIFHIHHAELAMEKMALVGKADLTSLEHQARLALYAEDHFALGRSEDDELTITTVGAEKIGQNIYVYQETDLPKPPNKLLIYCDFLRSEFGDQINLVDLNVNGSISSARLAGREYQKILIAK